MTTPDAWMEMMQRLADVAQKTYPTIMEETQALTTAIQTEAAAMNMSATQLVAQLETMTANVGNPAVSTLANQIFAKTSEEAVKSAFAAQAEAEQAALLAQAEAEQAAQGSRLSRLAQWAVQKVKSLFGKGVGEEAVGAAAEGGIVTSSLSSLGEAIAGLFGATVSSGAALALGALAVTAILGGAAYGLASWAGSHSGDNPVLAGPAIAGPHPTRVAGPQSSGDGPFFIYNLDMYSGYVFIGNKASVQTGPCNFPDGGPPPCPNVPNVKVLGTLGDAKGYSTIDAATAAFCKNVKVTAPGGSLAPSRGTVFGTPNLNLDDAPGCTA